MDAIEAAKAVTDEVLAARQAFTGEIFAVRGLIDRVGIEVRVPELPTLPPVEAKRAWLLASFVAATVYGEPDDTLRRDLDALLAEPATVIARS